jgi:hypothetical protein
MHSDRDAFSSTPTALFSVILLIALVTAQIPLNLHLQKTSKVSVSAQDENARRWDPRLFKMISFGQLPAAIDWMWIQVLLDTNLSHVPKGAHPAIYYHLDLITDLDPINFDSYKAGANLLAVIRDDGAGARDILEKAETFRKEKLASYPAKLRDEYWYNSWSIPMLLGYVYLFELQDLPHASQAFQEAANIPGSPAYLQSLQKRLQNPGGEYEVGLRVLNHMIGGEKDEDAKEGLIKKRDSLFVGQYLFDLNHSFQKFLEVRSHAKGTLQAKFETYLRETRTNPRDPWGGQLSLSPEGRVVTSTPHDKVFGLD